MILKKKLLTHRLRSMWCLNNMYNLLYLIIAFFICTQAMSQEAELTLDNEPDANQPAIELSVEDQQLETAVNYYKNRRFEASILLLKKLKDNPQLKLSAFYLLGLNYFKIQNFNLAEQYLSIVTKNLEIKEIASAYYYLGLVQYYKYEYEKALISFEVAQDSSDNPKLDKKIENWISKTLKAQTELDKSKLKYSLGLGLSILQDSNVLNVKPTTDDLTANIFNINGYFSYKAFVDRESSFEPLLFLSNNFTYNNQFQQNESIKASDVSVIMGVFPYKLQFDHYVSTTSANLGFIFLPSTSSEKDLAITLFFLKEVITGKVNSKTDSELKMILGRDESQLSYADASSNQTAIKFDISGALTYNIPQWEQHSVGGELGYLFNEAEGQNAKYKKIYFGLNYSLPTFYSTKSEFEYTNSTSNYYKSDQNRNDAFHEFKYTLSKRLSKEWAMATKLATSSNESNLETYNFSDFQIGLTANYLINF